MQRLSLTAEGKVRYTFKKEWRDGSSAVEMTPMTFLLRLAALIPAPRVNQLTYHGLLAPAAGYRDLVVPEPVETRAPACPEAKAAEVPEFAVWKRRPRRKRMLWATAMKRGLDLDVLTCDHCGGRREVLTFITDPRVITRILDHLGLPSELPAVGPARSPPGMASLFDM